MRQIHQDKQTSETDRISSLKLIRHKVCTVFSPTPERFWVIHSSTNLTLLIANKVVPRTYLQIETRSSHINDLEQIADMHFTRSIALLSTIAAAIALPMPGLSSRDDLTTVEGTALDGAVKAEGTAVDNPLSDAVREALERIASGKASLGDLLLIEGGK